MRKVETELGKYIDACNCNSCDWFWKPPQPVHGFCLPEPSVCPKCGDITVMAIGRYRIERTTTTYLLWPTKTEIEVIGFIKKEEKPLDHSVEDKMKTRYLRNGSWTCRRCHNLDCTCEKGAGYRNVGDDCSVEGCAGTLVYSGDLDGDVLQCNKCQNQF